MNEPQQPAQIKFDREQLLRSMRKISFENRMDQDASILLRFKMREEAVS